MRLFDYELKDWKNRKIQKRIKLKSNLIVLLSIDRTVIPPVEGRKNLLLIDSNDDVIWVADLPSEKFDSYYDMCNKKGVLNAHSSNGLSVNIDINSGELINKTIGY